MGDLSKEVLICDRDDDVVYALLTLRRHGRRREEEELALGPRNRGAMPKFETVRCRHPRCGCVVVEAWRPGSKLTRAWSASIYVCSSSAVPDQFVASHLDRKRLIRFSDCYSSRRGDNGYGVERGGGEAIEPSMDGSHQ
jgi:hypothetical protein